MSATTTYKCRNTHFVSPEHTPREPDTVYLITAVIIQSNTELSLSLRVVDTDGTMNSARERK